MKLDIERKVIKELVLAQMASSQAKKYWFCRNELYTDKARHIKNAIAMLNSNCIRNIHYKISRSYDQNGNLSNVYYFDIYLKRGKCQISFHGFDGLSPSGHREIKWDEKSSLATALKINRLYGLNIDMSDILY